MALRSCGEGNGVDWINQTTGSAPNGTVASLVPTGYEAYAQLLHAIHLVPGVRSLSEVRFESAVSASRGKIDAILVEMGAEWPPGLLRSRSRGGGTIGPRRGVRVSWKDLANYLGRELTQPASFDTDLWDSVDGDWPDELDGPVEGSLTIDEAQALVGILEPFTSRDVTFWYTWANTENYDGRCDVGSLADLALLFTMDEVSGSPEYWWPEDRSWVVHTNFDLSYTLIAGSNALIVALLNHPTLECVHLADDSQLWPRK